jgi:glycosyltransferase involved in cell wall biosynthesis
MQAMRLIEMWLEQGHEVISLGRRMGSATVTIAARHVETHRIRTLSKLGRLGRALSYAASLSLLLLKLRHRVDVVYMRFLGEGALTAALLKHYGLLNLPLVATPANTGNGGDLSFIKSIPMSGRLIRLLDKQCDAINLIAEDMAGELNAAGFSGANFTTIPNGIRVEPPATRSPSTMTRCVAVGRLSPQKGYDTLLEALARIRDQLSPQQFVIVGDGPEKYRLRQLAEKLGVSHYLTWRGELTQAFVRDEMHLAHLYLLPSRYEGMSNAGLEAMERSLPVILTRCGGLDCHVNSEMGWVVPPEDADGLADALSTALHEGQDKLAERGLLCRKVVEDRFNIEITSRRYVELFRELQNRLRSSRYVA